MHDIIVKNNVFKTCVGCIYLIPETIANNGSPCTNCSRAYTDKYTYTPTISTNSTYIASTGLGEDNGKQYRY